jgi:hypothetical protein
MYLNPFGFDMTRAGEEIISGPDAGAMFGQSAPVIPPNAKLDPAVGNVPPPAASAAIVPPTAAVVVPPPSAPNMGFVAGPPAPPSAGPPAPPAAPVVHRKASNGQQYTEEHLKGFGWTPEQINALPIGTGNDIPF